MDTAIDQRGDHHGRWADIDGLLLRPGSLVGAGFEPGEDVKSVLHDLIHVLVVGAGGLGCELLKDLGTWGGRCGNVILGLTAHHSDVPVVPGRPNPTRLTASNSRSPTSSQKKNYSFPKSGLSGFKTIDVIDMDTIDVSNLNRQFLFTSSDVGQSKSLCAARAITKRINGVTVTPHFCRIEEKPDDWYKQFHIIVLGLDSLDARSYINKVCCGFLKFENDGTVDQTTIKPMIDGGTEGFKGHARVLLPGVTPCFECTSWLFPPQTKFPLCTLAETPRSPAHCIEYVRLIQWPNEGLGLNQEITGNAGSSAPNNVVPAFDGDDPKHVGWVFEKVRKFYFTKSRPPCLLIQD